MDIRAELADGTIKTARVNHNCTTEDAVMALAKQAGLETVVDKLYEFSLAWKDANSEAWLNVTWLDPRLSLQEQGVDSSLLLLLRKKYFTRNEDLHALDSCSALRRNIYAQLRHTFTAGLYKCSTFQAVQIAALLAKVEFSENELTAGTLQQGSRLRQVLPDKFSSTAGIDQLILRANKSLRHLSREGAEKAFVLRMQKLETFGLALYTVAFAERGRSFDGLLGVGNDNIYRIDHEEMEVLTQWEVADLSNYYCDDSSFTLVFGRKVVTMATKHGHMIHSYLAGVKQAKPHGTSTGTQQNSRSTFVPGSGTRRVSEGDALKVSNAKQKSPPPKPPPKPPTRQKPLLKPKPDLVALSQQKQTPRHPPLRAAQSSPLVAAITKELGAASKNKREEKPPNSNKNPPLRPPSPTRAATVGKRAPLLPPRGASRGVGRWPQPERERERERGEIAPSTASPAEWGWDPQDYMTPVRHPDSMIPEDDDYTEIDECAVLPTPSPNPPSPGLSRLRGGRNAIKRKSTILSPTPPSPPPAGPRRVSSSSPNDQQQGEDPPIYEDVPDDMRELSQILSNSTDLSSEVQFSRDENPIYDTVAASEAQTLLRNSGVTYHALNDSFKRNLKMKKEFSKGDDQEKKHPPNKVEKNGTEKQSTQTKLAAKVPLLPPVAPRPTVGRRGGITKVGVVRGDMDYGEVYGGMGRVNITPPRPNPPSINPRQNKVLPPSPGIMKLGVTEPDPNEQEDNTPIYSEPLTQRISPLLPSSSKQNPPQQPKPPGIRKLGTRKNVSDYDDVFYGGVRDARGSPPPPSSKQSLALNNKRSGGNQPAITRIGVSNGGMDEQGEIYTSPEEMQQKSRPRLHSELPRTVSRKQPELAIFRGRVRSDSSVKVKHQSPTDVTGNGERVTVQGVGVRGEGELVKPRRVDPRPPKPPRARRAKREPQAEEIDAAKQPPRLMKPGEILKDYGTLLREYRIFFIKLPTGVIHTELANLTTAIHKLIRRLCVLLCAEDPSHYFLYVEGAALTSLKETEMGQDEEATPSGDQPLIGRGGRSGKSKNIDLFPFLYDFTLLPDQGRQPILLNPELSLKDHGITTTRVLALRPRPFCNERLPQHQIRLPDWVRFHQCWLSIVQGNHPCSLQDAIQLAALQYQAYFLDRTELNSVIGFCKSSEFLPLEYSSLHSVEERVFTEQQALKGYSHRQAQDSYIHACCSLPTHGAIFFPCKEVKKRVFQNNKLIPVLVGINHEGVMRVDPKTKEVLDLWPYKVLRNWGFSTCTFILDFVDSTYPVKTNQGKWMNELVEFHIEATLNEQAPSPPPHQMVMVMPPTSSSIPHSPPPRNRDDVHSPESNVVQEYEELFFSSGYGAPEYSVLSPSHPSPSYPAPSYPPPHYYHSLEHQYDTLDDIPPSSSPPSPHHYHVLEHHRHAQPYGPPLPYSVVPLATGDQDEAIYDLPPADVSPSGHQYDDIYDIPEH